MGSEGFKGQLEGSEGQPEVSEGQPEGCEGQPEGSEGQLDRWIDRRTDGIFPQSTGLCLLSGPLPKMVTGTSNE